MTFKRVACYVYLLPTNLAVHVEQSVRRPCVQTITFEANNLWPIYLACWFNLTLSRSSSKVKVVGQSSRSRYAKIIVRLRMHDTMWRILVVCRFFLSVRPRVRSFSGLVLVVGPHFRLDVSDAYRDNVVCAYGIGWALNDRWVGQAVSDRLG